MDQLDQTQQQQQPVRGVVEGRMAYASPTYNTASMVASGTPALPVPSSTQPSTSFPTSQHQLAYQQAHHFHHQQQQLQVFWTNQMQDIKQTTDFKNHSLPLAHIKKILKADEDVRMISAEAPVVYAKACENVIFHNLVVYVYNLSPDFYHLAECISKQLSVETSLTKLEDKFF